MVVNAFVVLLALVTLVEIALGVALVAIALRALRHDVTGTSDDRSSLLRLTTVRLVAVAVAGAVLLFLVLSNAVSEWPGVMCVQGVLRIGLRDDGPARWLPALLGASAVLTPCLLLAVGAGFTVAAVDRATRTGPFARTAALWMGLAGALAVANGVAVASYLAIPRGGRNLADGCCMVARDNGEPAVTPDGARRGWTVGFVASGVATAALTGAMSAAPRLARAGSIAWPAALTGLTAVAASGAWFVQTALSPAVLRLPLHECTFCVLAAAPEIWVGIVAGVVGCASVAWAAVAARCGRVPEADVAAAERSRWHLVAASGGITVAVVLMTTELWLA